MIARRLAPLAAALALALPVAACRDTPGSSDSHVASAAAAPSSAARTTATDDTPPRPASAAELAILAPAAPGGSLEGFDLRAVRVSGRGVVELLCEKASAHVTLYVAALVEGGPAPPASTDRYAVFYSLRGATPEDGERLSTALAKLLQENRAVPPPPGLGPFVPRPRSL